MENKEDFLFKNKYRIPSARQSGFDYADAGFYFVTICSHEQEVLFGEVINQLMVLSDIGRIAEKLITEIPKHFPLVLLDEFVVMPNHVHLIVEIKNNPNNHPIRRDVACNVSTNDVSLRMSHISPKRESLSLIIRSFKSATTKIVHETISPNFLWQPRFHDCIIRTDQELNRIRQYIINNPFRWDLDRNNPINLSVNNKKF